MPAPCVAKFLRAIFGFILSCLLRIRLFRIKEHYKDIINIDPNIRLVTICDVDGRMMYSRHRQGVKNLLTPEESKKSLEMAMTGWKVRNELSHKIGKGRYVLAEYEKIKAEQKKNFAHDDPRFKFSETEWFGFVELAGDTLKN